MTLNIDNLPDNIELLKELVIKLLGENEALNHRLSVLVRNAYGSKSEKLDPNQLELFKELLKEAQAGDSSKSDEDENKQPELKKKVKGHGRQKLPAKLPREKKIHDLPEDEKVCPKCGEDLDKIGEDTSEQLEFIPSSLKVIVHTRFKYACKHCSETILTADKPLQPIEKGLPGPGLLAHVAVSKYADHLPLNRLENIFNRYGVKLSRSTLCGWMMQIAEAVSVLYIMMIAKVLESYSIHTDDTPIKLRDAQMKQKSEGRFWVYRGDDSNPYTVYDYTSNRCHDGPENFLGDYAGKIHADAYAGYDCIYEKNDAVESGCWAHCRRYFFDAQDNDLARSQAAMAYIRRLYMIEREIKGKDADVKTQVRQEKAKPILAEFHQWLDEQRNDLNNPVLPQSPFGKAVTYTLNQWEALCRYADDGHLDIDNNAAERALRPIAVGRRNYLFVGSNRGGNAAAVIYSLIESAKRNGANVFEYLRDVFENLPKTKTSEVDKFLPDKWQSARNNFAQLQ